MPDELVPDAVPEGLRLASLGLVYQRLARNQAAIVDFVAVTLAQTLPGAVKVKRRGLAGRGPVEMVQVTLGDQVHELRVRGGGLEATRGEVVGGVVLRHDPVRIGDWVASLLRSLDQWAEDSDAARTALEHLR